MKPVTFKNSSSTKLLPINSASSINYSPNNNILNSPSSFSSPKHNPFKLPQGKEWLSLRRNYTLELSQQRANERNLSSSKLQQKHTFKTRNTGGALPRIRTLLKKYDKEAIEELKNNTSTVEEAHNLASKQNGYRTKPIQREFVSDIIANKRQLFLAEYVLQTKRQALTKLQESVQAAEKDLSKAEKKLENDATQFDDFLKATDKTAVEAMQNAEKVSSIRLQLVEKVKKYNLKKAMLQSELSRFDETLFQYLQMKKFIWQIYRDNWTGFLGGFGVTQNKGNLTKKIA